MIDEAFRMSCVPGFGINSPVRDEKASIPDNHDTFQPVRDEKPGYHLRDIKKGVVGEVSKIVEEVEELVDAVDQNVTVMALVELSDLYGAIQSYLEKHHPGMTMDDLRAMSDVTKRAFRNGRR